MPIYPVIIALIFAVLDWIAVEKHWRTLEYVSKPVTMLALIGWIGISTGFGGPIAWFTIGAIFCLAGDVFLMIPRDMFIFGLLAFLLGHIFYIIGLNDQVSYINLSGGIVMLLLGVYIAWLYPRLANSLKAKGKKELSAPVLVYSVVISLMVYSAIMTWSRAGWTDMAALSVSIGAILFYASDSILAWDRFVNPLNHGRLMNLSTYHLGQVGIIMGAILHSIK